MVHEINPNSDQGEGVVNSTSLEDVALSEVSWLIKPKVCLLVLKPFVPFR